MCAKGFPGEGAVLLKTIAYVFLIAYLSDWLPLISVISRQQIKAAAKYN